MRILYLSHWNLEDPLTQATVYPALEILQQFESVRYIHFVNVQRSGDSIPFEPQFQISKITHQQIRSRSTGNVIVAKLRDFIRIPQELRSLVKAHEIDFLIARGAVAGSLAYLVWKKIKIPFLVESFEPHSSYMLESGVWSRFDPRYLFQKAWEKQQKKHAVGLMPVSVAYARRLTQESVSDERIRIAPCGVDMELFSFKPSERSQIRNELGLTDQDIVGIYSGKFGGMYLESEAFILYKLIFDQVPDFYLLVLSPREYHDWIRDQIAAHNLPAHRITVKFAQHAQVSRYCSASDIALATYKPGSSKAYLSPVKVGEYWANGLPVLLTKGVGDESVLIEKGFGGALFDPESINATSIKPKLMHLVELARKSELRDVIAAEAAKLRSFDRIREAYNYFLVK